MEAGLPLLEPKGGQALLSIRARVSGQISQHLRQQKKFYHGDLCRGIGCGWVSVA